MTPATLGELRGSGWVDRPVKEEIRANLVARLRAGDELFPGIIGYEDTVLPALERALLAGHDLIFLGERGQAKTRLIRRLVELLDPKVPIIEGCEVNDSPYDPICAGCRQRLAELGEALPIRWRSSDQRFAEKLATPDTAVADLIGDVDPIRVAEGRYLSDEMTIHYGLVPRAHRGIFSINELPDLPPRIQVSLLNVLEERDVQIRGFTVRLPIDVLLVATANPEDYTNRGRIITPLKDRFGSEIRTHYPIHREHEVAIMLQESRSVSSDMPIAVPGFLEEIVAEFTRQVRASSQVNRRSGVSVRLSIANLETLRASAIRRALRSGESEAVPRICDLWNLVQSSTGKVEFEVFEEGREQEILERLLSQAILDVFRRHLLGFDFRPLLDRFEMGFTVETGELVPAETLLTSAGGLDTTGLLIKLGLRGESPGDAASALELALEGLHLTRRLNKEGTEQGAIYGA
jgi:magnesium chelatase subunit I